MKKLIPLTIIWIAIFLLLCAGMIGLSIKGCGKHPSLKNNKEALAAPAQDTIHFVFYDNCHPTLQSILMQQVSLFYNCVVTKDITQTLPRMAYYPPRNRYRADAIIYTLKQQANQNIKVLGFTNKDISITSHGVYDYGIFGLGYQPGEACVVSSFRLKGDKNKCVSVCLHEIGHNYGLEHCSDVRCIMSNDANTRTYSINLCIDCKLILNKLN